MIFASEFDARLFRDGPPALFTLDPKGKLRVDPERTREAYLTVTPAGREEAHYVLTDKVTRLRLYVLVTHPSLATATAERTEATRYGTYEEAVGEAVGRGEAGTTAEGAEDAEGEAGRGKRRGEARGEE